MRNPHRGHARSLDSGPSRRNPVLQRRSAYKSLTARRAPARPPPPQPTPMPAPAAGIRCTALDKRSSIRVRGDAADAGNVVLAHAGRIRKCRGLPTEQRLLSPLHTPLELITMALDVLIDC